MGRKQCTGRARERTSEEDAEGAGDAAWEPERRDMARRRREGLEDNPLGLMLWLRATPYMLLVRGHARHEQRRGSSTRHGDG